MDIDPPKALSAEALPIFSEGIGLILSQWWALQMAVENEWGGRDSRLKADQIASDIVSWFTHSKGITFIYLFIFNFFCEFRVSSWIFGRINEMGFCFFTWELVV